MNESLPDEADRRRVGERPVGGEAQRAVRRPGHRRRVDDERAAARVGVVREHARRRLDERRALRHDVGVVGRGRRVGDGASP